MAIYMEWKMPVLNRNNLKTSTSPTPENSVFMNSILFFTNNFSKAWKMMFFQKIHVQKKFD